MPNVVSSAKRHANRRNAKRSTGPKSGRGKAKSSINALKHGLLARNVVLVARHSPERRREFERLLKDFVKDLKPRSVLEHTLVERVATCFWRLHRAQRYEVEALQESVAEPPRPSKALIENLAHQLQHHDEALRITNRLLPLLRRPPHQLSDAEAADVDEGLEKLAERWPNIPTDRMVDVDRIRDRLFGLAETCACDAVQLQIRMRAAEVEHTPDVHRKRKNAALPHGDNLTRLVRYETMLDREFHRALSELRALQRLSLGVGEPIHDDPRSKPAVAATRARRKASAAEPCAEGDTT